MSGEELTKLRILLKHWVEHNEEHSQEFITWASKAQAIGEAETGEKMLAAAEEMNKAGELLSQALGELGEE